MRMSVAVMRPDCSRKTDSAAALASVMRTTLGRSDGGKKCRGEASGDDQFGDGRGDEEVAPNHGRHGDEVEKKQRDNRSGPRGVGLRHSAELPENQSLDEKSDGDREPVTHVEVPIGTHG